MAESFDDLQNKYSSIIENTNDSLNNKNNLDILLVSKDENNLINKIILKNHSIHFDMPPVK